MINKLIKFILFFVILLGFQWAHAQRYRIACDEDTHIEDNLVSGDEMGIRCNSPHGTAGPCNSGNVGSAQGSMTCSVQAENNMTGTPYPGHGDPSNQNCECVDCETNAAQIAFLTHPGPTDIYGFACEGYVSGGPTPPPSPTPAPGTETRSVVCRDDLGTVVADSFCITNVGPKPPTSRVCGSGGADCTVTAGTTWNATGNTCTVPADLTVADGLSATATDSTAPTTGSATWSCTAGVLSGPTSTSCTAAGGRCWSGGGPCSIISGQPTCSSLGYSAGGACTLSEGGLCRDSTGIGGAMTAACNGLGQEQYFTCSSAACSATSGCFYDANNKVDIVNAGAGGYMWQYWRQGIMIAQGPYAESAPVPVAGHPAFNRFRLSSIDSPVTHASFPGDTFYIGRTVGAHGTTASEYEICVNQPITFRCTNWAGNGMHVPLSSQPFGAASGSTQNTMGCATWGGGFSAPYQNCDPSRVGLSPANFSTGTCVGGQTGGGHTSGDLVVCGTYELCTYP